MTKKLSSLIPAEVIEDYAEIGADKLVDAAKQYVDILEPLGDETPYVKTLVAALRLPRTISDFILGKKVYAFLYASNLSEEKICKLAEKFSQVKRGRLWEQVVLAINVHDNMAKTEITGKLFDALIEDAINEFEFFSMLHATNSININTLESLKDYYSLSEELFNGLTTSQIYSFMTVGLIGIDNSGIGTLGGGGPVYPLNQLGWKYVGIVFNYPSSAIDGVKIGCDELVLAYTPETKQATGKAYPLSYIKKKHLMHEEVDLFVVNDKKEVLCNSNGLPEIISTKVPVAGVSQYTVALEIAKPYGTRIHAILGSALTKLNVKKTAYILKHNEPIDDLNFNTIDQIDKAFEAFPPEDEQIRYLVECNEQMKRYATGELNEFWDRF